jgi:hypothetical protein
VEERGQKHYGSARNTSKERLEMTRTGPFANEEPDADWTDDYSWTRYRGPQPYPCPEDWVLNIVEGDAAVFRRYPELGQDHETDDEVVETFAPEYKGLNEARGEEASVSVDYDRNGDESPHSLQIGSEVVFRRVEPDPEDLWATVADVLARVARGEDYQDVAPTTGSPPTSVLREREIERHKQENQQLTEFTS